LWSEFIAKADIIRYAKERINISSQGVKIEELTKIFKISHKTLYNWFNRWESEGMIGLYNKPGRGCKPTFNLKEKNQRMDQTRTKTIKTGITKGKERMGIKVSTKTIQRILKMLSMSWHRMRRGVRGEPNLESTSKKAQLEEFKRLEDEGKLYLYYLDETGFCLIPSVLWMAKHWRILNLRVAVLV